MAEKKDSCSLAVSLAVASLVNNGDLARRLAELSEQANKEFLYEDALREGVDLGIEGDAKQLAREYSLKQESTNIKFKAVLFGGLLANTAQGDDAIRQLMQAMAETGGSVAEAQLLLDIMAKMDLSSMEEVAQAIGGTVEEATEIMEGIRKKINYYLGSNYSVVTSGSQVKAKKVVEQLEKELKKSEELLISAKATLGDKTYKSVNKDLARLKNGAKDNKRYWNTKAGREELNKMADKYGKPHNKQKLENYLEDIIQAQKVVDEQTKEMERLTKEYLDALNGDLKIIEDGQNPFEYVGADAEWKFNKSYNKDISKRVLDYGQYVMARTLLTDSGLIPQEVYDILTKAIKQTAKKGITNYIDEDLTEDWILSEDRTLDELLSRAYTNTQQLTSNGQLRETYRQRLISLASDGDLTSKDVSYIESLLRTMRLAGEGAGFADIFKYNTLLDNAKELGVTVPKNDGKSLWNSILSFFQDDNYDALLLQNKITLKNGTEVTQRQLLELVSGMLNDLNIYKLIASNDYTDSTILDIAGKYLTGDKKEGNKRLMSLISAVKEVPTTDDTRGVILKAITNKDIPEGTPVGFFDFRSMLEAADDVKARAEFRDRLADANKLNIPSNTIKNITTTNVNQLIKQLEGFKGGYILVNDSQWKMNSVLNDALNAVNKGLDDADKVKVAFPKGGLMGKLTWEDGRMVFKTSYSQGFDDFLRRISIRTLGQTAPDSALSKDLAKLVTGGDIDAISEMNKLLEQDARKYFGEMLGIDPYDEHLTGILQDLTGISFKNYDAVVDKAEFWRKIDEKFMVGLRTVGTYDQEATTIADVIKQVDSMSPAQMSKELSHRFGYEITEESITEGGKIKDNIRNAYLNYQLSQSPIEILENKGRLLAVINGGVADNITMEQFKSMLLSKDYSAYKDIFFHNTDISDEMLEKLVRNINAMVMDGLSAQVADNLVAMGYSLPLVNVRDMVYDYLTNNLNVNGQFANAFIYKNNLPPTLSTLEGIMNQAVPSQLRFGYDDAVQNISQDMVEFYNMVYKNGVPYENGVRIWGAATNDEIVDFIDAIQEYDFRGRRNIKQLAIQYQIPIEVMDEYISLFRKDAWAFTVVKKDKGILEVLIAARKKIAKGALPHELFHGIFNYVPIQEREAILQGAMNLYGLNETKANEMLADLFSDYYRTGTFVLPREEYVNGVPGFKDIILKAFKTIKKWILGVDKYEKELRKLYDDILDLKYVNKELRDEVDLYGLTLAENFEYLSRDTRYITFDFDDLVDAAEKEGRIPARFMYEDRTRYDIINKMTNQEWFNDLSQEQRDGYRAQVSFLEALEELYKNPGKKKISFADVKKRALEKGKGFQREGDPKKAMDELDVDDVTIGGYEISPRDVNSVKVSKADASVTKSDTYTSRETIPLDMAPIIEQRGLPYIKEIRDAILAGKTIPFKEYIEFQINHFKDIGSDYGDAMANIFSKIDETNIGSINSISDIYGLFGKSTELEKNYDALRDAFAPQGTEIEPYRGFAPSGIGMMFFNKRVNIPDYITRYVEVENEFVPDTYSSLVAMSAVRNGANLPNVGHERQLLKNILDDYYNTIKNATDGGKTLSFSDAQKLKTKAGYALDMFEQDYLMSRYKQFLTPDERSELFGLKYSLGVTTDSRGLNDILEYNNRILDRYDNATKRIINQNDIMAASLSKTSKSVSEEIEKRQRELIEQGATMKVVDGQVIVVDTRQELYRQLQAIPDSVNGLGVLKSLGRRGLDQLSNEEAYFLLNVVELAKNADNKMNMVSQTIYKMKPQLARLDFFRTFRAVDGLPYALRNNLLTGTDYLAKFNNTATFDDSVKRNIFSEIKQAFIKNGRLGYKSGKKEVSAINHLNEIIDNAIAVNVHELGNSVKGAELEKFKKEAALLYQTAFNPYTILEDVPEAIKDSMDEILTQQQRGIREALDLLGENNRLTEIMDSISIQLDDGSVKTFRQILDGDKNNLSKTLFDTDLDAVNSADENAKQFIDPSWSESKREAKELENKKIIEATENNYREGLQAYLNESEIVAQGERELLKRVWTSARELAKQYMLTNKLADTDNALAGINEEIIRGFKADILGFKGLLTRGGQSWLAPGAVGKNLQDSIMKRRGEVKDRYRTLYSMTPEQLEAFKPKNALDNIASNLAKYFKEIELRLGSIDGITGATTDININKAFAHIGEVVMNIDSIQGLYSIMSGIEGNQLLKFFRFSNVGDLSRVDKLSIGGLGKEEFGGYRNYVDRTDEGLDREWFNKTFASNFSDSEYNKMIQALCGFTIINKNFKLLQGALNFVNGSNYLFRVLMSYPGQLVTIGQQSIAYFLKQVGREKELGAEDLGAIDKIRTQAGILNGAYNEIPTLRYASPDNVDPSAFYNRYGLPDVSDLMNEQKFYTSDDLATMYSKIDDYGAKGGSWWTKFLRNTDAYKDNANNIIDGLFARNFKNIAFLKALQTNNYMTFATAEEFANFMSSNAPIAMKKKLMSTIMESSGRNFRNILGLGFSGLDRAVGGNYIRNIWIGLMQMFNFRGAWGQNMARQTSNWIMTGINMARKGLSKEGKDAIASYIAHQPEFVNFSKQLFNDLQNMWHITRLQDNGDWMPEDEHSLLDFVEYAYEVMQFSSQRWQGIQSYGTTRIGTAWAESAMQSYVNPEVYKDTYGVGALMNNISKNLGRNWKVPNLGMKALAQLTTNGGRSAAMEYLGNEFWKLSFGTLRYLMNEDETAYGYSAELIGGRPGAIPFIISGETNDDGDKAYSYDLSNSETWLNLSSWYDALRDGDNEAARVYAYNNLDSFINGSQAWSFIKNIAKALRPALGETTQKMLSDGTWLTGRTYAIANPWDLAEVGDIIAETAAGKDLFSQGYYVPKAEADIEILVNEVLKQRSHRPGNDGFNKSMFNFDKSGHMASLDESNEADASMEMLLNNIKYERDENFRFVTDEQGRKIVTDYWQMHMDDLNRRINDEDYLTTSNYNFINGWVEANNDDPNYMLYKRLIGEGLAGRYMTEKVTEYIDGYNKLNGLKKDAKLIKKEVTDASGDYQLYAYLSSLESDITGERRGFLESIMLLDKPAAMSANIKMVARQMKEIGHEEDIKKMFNVNEKGDISLSSRYKSFLEEEAKLSSYLNKGDLESFIAETSSITDMFKKDDPYGVATTVLISSRINRINQAENLSPTQKAAAINVLMTDNYEFIQKHIPEFIDELGTAAKAYITQMNESIYDISLIGDDLTRLSEMNNSKSGRSNGVSISNKAKNLLGKLGKSNGTGDGVGGKSYNYNFVPVKLEGSKLLKATGSKGYNPKTATIALQQYKPHVDLSISKDINRTITGPKTQTVTKKKQLSKLESDVTKALEAES